jgi:hypothetical protein
MMIVQLAIVGWSLRWRKMVVRRVMAELGTVLNLLPWVELGGLGLVQQLDQRV